MIVKSHTMQWTLLAINASQSTSAKLEAVMITFGVMKDINEGRANVTQIVRKIFHPKDMISFLPTKVIHYGSSVSYVEGRRFIIVVHHTWTWLPQYQWMYKNEHSPEMHRDIIQIEVQHIFTGDVYSGSLICLLCLKNSFQYVQENKGTY